MCTPMHMYLQPAACSAHGHAHAAAPDRPPGARSPAAPLAWQPPLVSRTPAAYDGGESQGQEPTLDDKKCQSGCQALTLLPGSAAAVTLPECLAIMASRSAYSLRWMYVTWSQNIRARRWYLHEQESTGSSELLSSAAQ